MGDDSHNITPERVKAQEALQNEGQNRLRGNTPAANAQGAKASSLFAQDQIHEHDNTLGNSEQSKKDKYLQLLGQTNKEIAQSHYHLVANGFNSPEDFNRFGSMLGSDDYWNYLQNNPEEHQKVADEMSKGLIEEIEREITAGRLENSPEAAREYADKKINQMAEHGGSTPEEKEKIKKRAHDTLNSSTFNRDIEKFGVERSQEISRTIEVATDLGGKEKVDAVIDGNVKYEASLEKNENETTTATQDFRDATSEKYIAITDLKNNVLDNAEARSIKTERDDAKKENNADLDSMAAQFGNNPDVQAAAKTLDENKASMKEENSSLALTQVAKSNEIETDTSRSI